MGFLFSKLFSWLIDRFNIYSMYGSLTIVIISMFWLYYSMYFLFFGAFINTFPAILRRSSENSAIRGCSISFTASLKPVEKVRRAFLTGSAALQLLYRQKALWRDFRIQRTHGV